MRVASVPSWKFADAAVKHGIWGSNRSRFGKWDRGEILVLLVGKEGVVVATVAGKAFQSDQMIWDEDLYEFRIPIHVEQVMRDDAGKAAAAAVRKALASGLGNIYGTYIMSQSKLSREVEQLVTKVL